TPARKLRRLVLFLTASSSRYARRTRYWEEAMSTETPRNRRRSSQYSGKHRASSADGGVIPTVGAMRGAIASAAYERISFGQYFSSSPGLANTSAQIS